MKTLITAYAILLTCSLLNHADATQGSWMEAVTDGTTAKPKTIEECFKDADQSLSLIEPPGHIERVKAVIREKNKKLFETETDKSFYRILQEHRVEGVENLDWRREIKDVCEDYMIDVRNIVEGSDCASLTKGLDRQKQIAIVDSYPHWKDTMVAIKLCDVVYE